MVREYLEYVTAERIRELLSYDPETGVFRWRVNRGRTAKAGSVAGWIGTGGYREITIDGQRYQAYRLAWFYMTGEWPAEEVDYDNGIPGDDRFKNLREATRPQNSWNSRKPRTNTSGVKGVSWHASRGKWQASIRLNDRRIHLGYFTNINDAAAAYAAASEKHHGEFGRTG